MKNKINSRLIGLSVFSIIITALLLTIVYYTNFRQQVENDLSLTAHVLASNDFINEKTDLSSVKNDIRITWIDRDGSVLYDNDVDNTALDNHLNRQEVADAFKNGEGKCIRTSDTLNLSTYYYALKLNDGTVLRVAKDAQSITAIFLHTVPYTLGIIIVVAFVCLLISNLLTKQLVRPINDLADNLDSPNLSVPYKELVPITDKIRKQHADILSASQMRQEFTANVSHELKTPLTSILGYTELMESEGIDEKQKKHFITEIKNNVDRLLNLINDIMKVSQLSTNDINYEFTDLNLYEIAKDQLQNFEIEARSKNIKLILEGKSEIIKGNKGLIEELVDNLVQNAIRYGNENGYVKVNVGDINNKVSLCVEDNGIGIPLSEQERIFERFYRVDKSRSKKMGGTGLGLAIVKHIVQIHEAKINLKSTPGVGTKIEVIFQ